MMDKPTTDVLIIGGGMVGISLAAMLPESLSVLLIDSFPIAKGNDKAGSNKAPMPQPSFDARSTALSSNSKEILSKYGLWSSLSVFAEPIKAIHASNRGSWGAALMEAEREQVQALGYVIENASLGYGLLQSITSRPSVTIISPADVIRLIAKANSMTVEYQQRGVQQPQSISASLAIVADGAQSPICRSQGIDIDIRDYHHKAIVANVVTTLPHGNIAYERFTKQGPLALLPLKSIKGENRSALIWTMPNDEADEKMQLENQQFAEVLQARFSDRLGRFTHVGKRDLYPLTLSKANEQVRQNLVVLGNAAHSLHPVAGQGFNLALRDSDTLCVYLEKALKCSRSIGDLSVLQAYYEARKFDQDATIWFSDKLPELFSTSKMARVLANNLGLISLDIMPSVKSSFVDFASGVRKAYADKTFT